MNALSALQPERLERALHRLRNPPPGGKIEAAQRFGIDLTLLIENLQLSPAQRADRMQAASVALESVRGSARRKPS